MNAGALRTSQTYAPAHPRHCRDLQQHCTVHLLYLGEIRLIGFQQLHQRGTQQGLALDVYLGLGRLAGHAPLHAAEVAEAVLLAEHFEISVEALATSLASQFDTLTEYELVIGALVVALRTLDPHVAA